MNMEDLKILFHLKEYLNLLIEQGTDKIFYDTLFNDEKTIDCINALNNLIEECSNKNQIISDLQKENTKISDTNRKLTAITNNYEAYELPFTDDEDKIIIASKKYFVNGFFKNNFISKALIKRKINEYEYLINDFEITDNSGRFKKENSINYYKLEALKELLKEGESDEKL